MGFEPTRHCCPPVFKTGSIGHSDSPPWMPVAILTERWSLFLEVPCERRGDPVIQVAARALGRDGRDLVGCLPHRDAEAPAGDDPFEHLAKKGKNDENANAPWADDAIKAYNAVLEGFSGNAKAPAAQLHKALSLLAQNKKDAGVSELRSLVHRHPQTPEADPSPGASLVSGAVEGSNVNPTDMLVSMIQYSRQFEMQVRVLHSGDENARSGNSLLSSK